jgi:hypothetical protein
LLRTCNCKSPDLDFHYLLTSAAVPVSFRSHLSAEQDKTAWLAAIQLKTFRNSLGKRIMSPKYQRTCKSIGFIATRFAGTDGVSIAARHNSYGALRKHLSSLMLSFFGMDH